MICKRFSFTIASVLCLLVAACGEDNEARKVEPDFHAVENPAVLSDWGDILVNNGALELSSGVKPYDLASPLFSDYAHKLRTIRLPEGSSAKFRENQTFEFPVGTVITKTFYYPRESGDWTGTVMQDDGRYFKDGRLLIDDVRLIETRILVRRENGWDALPYVWNEAQSDATLQRIGDIQKLTLVRQSGESEAFSYVVPNTNQCAGCHATNATTREIRPIGPKARHLHKPSSYSNDVNQLVDWEESGILSDLPAIDRIAANVDWANDFEKLTHRARSYLDINCSHCHNPNGPADTSGLNLEPEAYGPALGVCKSPIAAGGGTGGRAHDISPGKPDESIFIYRLQSTDPGDMMPEVGRSVMHKEGVALIADWISAMVGDCS